MGLAPDASYFSIPLPIEEKGIEDLMPTTPGGGNAARSEEGL
jgi:hypothetical protein